MTSKTSADDAIKLARYNSLLTAAHAAASLLGIFRPDDGSYLAGEYAVVTSLLDAALYPPPTSKG